MAELAPGIFVTDWLAEPGTAFVLNGTAFGLPDCGADGKGIVLHQADWDRLPPAEREALLDDITRRSAEDGLKRLERWLGGNPA